MIRRIASLALLFCLSLVAHKPLACGAHDIYINPGEFGLIGGTVIRLAGLAPPEPVFKIKHRSMARAELGSESDITIEYDRPWFSKDVRMELSSTDGVTLKEKTIELDKFDGSVDVSFTLDKPGFNNIKIKVSGLHKGEVVQRSSVIYIQAKKSVAKVDAP